MDPIKKENAMTIAIYAIQCFPAAKYYVGSSTRLESRFVALRSALRQGKHACQELQSDWTRFGESAFGFLMLEKVSNLADLPEREKYYLSTLDCYKTFKVSNPNAYAGKSYTSDKMIHAMELIKSGSTAYAAAKAAGVSESTISRSRLYREWLAGKGKTATARKRRFE